MRAWRVHAYGPPEEVLRLDDVELPVPGPGQVRIRVGAAALNLPDDRLCRGTYQLKPDLPFTPGLEVAGTVEAAGPGTRTKPGSRAMAVTALPHGGLAEAAIADEANVYSVPDDMDYVAAAATLIAFHTGHFALHRRGRLQVGETLLVHAGAGGVGSAAIQIGRAAGARVFATAGGAEKVAVCRELGAELVIDYLAEDFVRRVREATAGRGVDVIYDPVGGDVFDRSRRCIANEGRILIVGFASGDVPKVETNQVLYRNYSLVGVYVGAYAGPDGAALRAETHAAVLALHAAGRIKPLVRHTVGLSEVPRAVSDLAARRTVGKVVVRPDRCSRSS